jgi:hypothetical protein
MEEEKNMFQNAVEQVEEKIRIILDEGIHSENLETLGELIDIHKDLCNEKYWKKKEEVMDMNYNRGYGEYGNYGEYGEYGRRRRDSRGRYMRRGVDSRYQGHEMIDEMHDGYQEYSEGREAYNRGNYGAKNDTMKSLDYMLQSVTQFIEMLKQDASSQEEMELIKKYTREISEM